MISAFDLHREYTPARQAHLLLELQASNIRKQWESRRAEWTFPPVYPDVAPYLEAAIRLKGYAISNNSPAGLTLSLGKYHPLVKDNENPQFYIYVNDGGAISFIRGEIGAESVNTDNLPEYQRVVQVPYLLTEKKERFVGFRQGEAIQAYQGRR